MVGYTFYSMPRTSQNVPTNLGGSEHGIKGVADHFGGFRAWIPEQSDFLKGPKGPKGPLSLERNDFFKGVFSQRNQTGTANKGTAKKVASLRDTASNI